MSIQRLSEATLGAGSTVPSAGRFAQISGGTYTTYTSGSTTYGVHTFTASGTLTVASSGVVDVLVVGGGGGGGSHVNTSYGGGGGGAGAFHEITGLFLDAGSHTVTVGAGATVGAGSTITKHIADDQLAIARGRQRNIEGWLRPTKKD